VPPDDDEEAEEEEEDEEDEDAAEEDAEDPEGGNEDACEDEPEDEEDVTADVVDVSAEETRDKAELALPGAEVDVGPPVLRVEPGPEEVPVSAEAPASVRARSAGSGDPQERTQQKGSRTGCR
jgi:hypothetical protein